MAIGQCAGVEYPRYLGTQYEHKVRTQRLNTKIKLCERQLMTEYIVITVAQRTIAPTIVQNKVF